MMKKALLSLGLLSLSGLAQADTAVPAGAYQIDPAHSKVGFEIPHLVISTVEGRFNEFKGDINVGESFDKSTVQVDAEVKSIDTGVADRDKHLKSADFFDVAKNPRMSFKSKSIEGK